MRIDDPTLVGSEGPIHHRRWKFAEATANSSATIDFTWALEDVVKFSHFEFLFFNAVPATDDVQLFIRLSTDGSTFDSAADTYEFHNWYADSNPAGFFESSSNSTQMPLVDSTGTGAISNVTTEGGISGRVWLTWPDIVRNQHLVAWEAALTIVSNDRLGKSFGAGTYKAAISSASHGPILGLQFLMGAGNIAEGTFIGFGVNEE